MRAYTPGGRFTTDFELNAIADGITADSTNPVGTTAQWWSYNSAASVKDPIYDVEPVGAGRVWTGPAILKVIKAIITQGSSAVNERGFYNTDVLSITINMDVIDGSSLSGGESLPIPELKYLPSNPDAYLRDRIVFKDQVFTPKRVLPKGIITNDYTLFDIDCYQVNPEELVNDPQFQQYANYSPFDSKDTHANEGIPG